MSAQWKPGYHGPACQGPLHRRKIFAKDQPLQAWRGPHACRGPSTEVSLDRGSRQGLGEAAPSLAKAFHSRGYSASLTGRTWPLHPPQSPRRAATGDAKAVVAIFVYKAVNKAASRKADNEACHFGDKGTVCSYAPRATSPWDPSHVCSASPPSWLDGASFQLW